jgi:predicted phage-related endonuclease
MTITYHADVVQGSDEWLAMRRGMLTASEMSRIITAKTLKPAADEKARTHVYELVAQRLTGYVEPQYVSDAMLRGHEDEAMALSIYCDKVEQATACGFVTNVRHGFPIGYSPDALVGDHGQVECKSRAQKYQAQTIVEHVLTGSASIPAEYVIQVQTGLIVTERKWCDFVSYCGGMPMCIIRVYPDDAVQQAIIEAACDAESRIESMLAACRALPPDARCFPTERIERKEMLI